MMNINKLTTIFILLFISILSAGTLNLQFVDLMSSAEVSDVNVDIYDYDSNVLLYSYISDADGILNVNNLKSGIYSLRASKNGYSNDHSIQHLEESNLNLEDKKIINNRVQIKFLGEDWIINEMIPPKEIGIPDVNKEIGGGSIKIARECAYSSKLQISKSLDLTEGNKLIFVDLKHASGKLKDMVSFSIVNNKGEVIANAEIPLGETTGVMAGDILYKIRVYKTSSKYNPSEKWIEVSVFDNELELIHNKKLEDNNDWRVHLIWKDKDLNTGGTTYENYVDHLHKIQLISDSSKDLLVGDSISIVENPTNFKFTFTGLDLVSSDYEKVNLDFESKKSYYTSKPGVSEDAGDATKLESGYLVKMKADSDIFTINALNGSAKYNVDTLWISYYGDGVENTGGVLPVVLFEEKGYLFPIGNFNTDASEINFTIEYKVDKTKKMVINIPNYTIIKSDTKDIEINIIFEEDIGNDKTSKLTARISGDESKEDRYIFSSTPGTYNNYKSINYYSNSENSIYSVIGATYDMPFITERGTKVDGRKNSITIDFAKKVGKLGFLLQSTGVYGFSTLINDYIDSNLNDRVNNYNFKEVDANDFNPLSDYYVKEGSSIITLEKQYLYIGNDYGSKVFYDDSESEFKAEDIKLAYNIEFEDYGIPICSDSKDGSWAWCAYEDEKDSEPVTIFLNPLSKINVEIFNSSHSVDSIVTIQETDKLISGAFEGSKGTFNINPGSYTIFIYAPNHIQKSFFIEVGLGDVLNKNYVIEYSNETFFPEPVDVIVELSENSVNAGTEVFLSAKVIYSNGIEYDVTSAVKWDVSNVGKLYDNELVTQKVGTHTIKATYLGITGSNILTVSNSSVNSVSVSASKTSMNVDDKSTLTCNLIDEHSNSFLPKEGEIKYTTSCGSISGNVFTSSSVCTATITCTYTADSSIYSTLTIDVTKSSSGGSSSGGSSTNKDTTPTTPTPITPNTGNNNDNSNTNDEDITTIKFILPDEVDEDSLIEIVVTDLNGNPVEGIEIIIMNPDGEKVSLYSDSNGLISFNADSFGNYFLYSDDYAISGVRVIYVNPYIPEITETPVTPPKPVIPNKNNSSETLEDSGNASRLSMFDILAATISGEMSIIEALKSTIHLWILIAIILISAAIFFIVYTYVIGKSIVEDEGKPGAPDNVQTEKVRVPVSEPPVPPTSPSKTEIDSEIEEKLQKLRELKRNL